MTIRYLIAVLLSAYLMHFMGTTPTQIKNKQAREVIKISRTVPVIKPVLPPKTPVGVKAATVSTEPQPIEPMTHVELMAAAGIQPEDYGAADYIITHESNWNPEATEPTSGAHGLPQALPYSKTGCGWSDELCQLRWANSYAVARYGGWWQAQAYWATNRNW